MQGRNEELVGFQQSVPWAREHMLTIPLPPPGRLNVSYPLVPAQCSNQEWKGLWDGPGMLSFLVGLQKSGQP